jgi:FtsZ-binding cell division protein ZapB
MPSSNTIPKHDLPYDPRQAPPDYIDPVIEAIKKDVDRTLLRQHLQLTVEERVKKAESFHEAIEEMRAATDALHRQTARFRSCTKSWN